MRQYVIDFVLSKQLTAGPKAREDVNQILAGMGYETILLSYSRRTPVQSLLSIFSVFFRVSYGSKVLIQYPIGRIVPTSIVIILLKIKRCRITLLVHDLESLRRSGHLSSKEMYSINSADKVIVHTLAMKQLLVQSGMTVRDVRILNVFDYLIDYERVDGLNRENVVVFVGNLVKAPCVLLFDKCGILFHLYGAKDPRVNDNKVIYKGKFQSNDMRPIEGDWGLVWDGESVETCSGVLGEYLRYNAPHKLSLYLSAGLPVIVWSQSAEKDFVVNNGLGIAVDNLMSLGKVLDCITDLQYVEMKKNVRALGAMIHQGDMLKKTLE